MLLVTYIRSMHILMEAISYFYTMTNKIYMYNYVVFCYTQYLLYREKCSNTGFRYAILHAY